jgi:signal transduction histidine kinase
MMIVGRYFGARRRPPRLDQMILICIPAVIILIVLYGLYYFLLSAWQLLAMAGGGCAALAGLALSLFLNRRQRPIAAANLVLLSLLVVLGVVPLFVEGLTFYIVVSAFLLSLVVGAEILPGRWRLWLTAGTAFGILAWTVDQLAPLPRYALALSSLLGPYLLSANATFLLVIVWYTTLAAFRALASIRARLFITALLLVLFTGGAISYFSTIVLMHEEQEQAIERLNAVARHKQRQIDEWTNGMQTALALFARSARPQLSIVLAPNGPEQASYSDALQHLQADLTDTIVQVRLYNGLYIVDAHGNLMVSAAGAGNILPALESSCIQHVSSAPCLEPPRYLASLGRVAIVATQPIIDQYGHVSGKIASYAGLDALTKIAAEPDSLGDTGSTYLVAADNTLLTLPRSMPAQITAPIQPTAIPTQGAKMALAAHENGWSFYENERGVPVVGVYRWLPKLQSALLAEQDQAEAFQFSLTLRNVHLGVTLILLATAAVMTLYVVRSITAPLGYLAATAERIADGALDLTADIKRDDEIGALARVFNQMTARLHQARDQLEQRSRELAGANTGLQAENVERRRAEQELQLERNKLRSILDAMEDGVYIVNQQYDIEYTNPALEREFGPIDGRKCYSYLYGGTDVCPWCPNQQVWHGRSVRREQASKAGKIYEIFDAPLDNADGTRAKLAIVHDVTARKQAQDEILQRNHDLAILSRRLVEIQESERQYISRELHDETGQALTSIMLRLGMLERDLQRGMPVADRVAELKHTVEEVLEDLHGLAIDLRPSSLDHVGLAPALRQFTERIAELHGLVVDFGAIGLDEQRLPPEMEVTIYRIVQEALVNVVRHAQATHADVLVERRMDRVRVIVEDNGHGFDAATAMYSGRLGLLGMRERADMLGGRLEIDSAPGAGTTVVMEIAYDTSHSDRR